ncbi:thiamine pyrophosphokinase [Fimicolochytrium jonesii]|uniref:thiamine pyrophosphokinase n=1 Tax=Fimicolochytrium jonesii TaxID=1396493 RepID=UPI0022FEA12B|nr:thiamine pyrophosphokinase [Fimicolochytrium jonesii]KAI8821105.1 thiamine pyrophosphokinase [Fimicolochytrium jonesii]
MSTSSHPSTPQQWCASKYLIAQDAPFDAVLIVLNQPIGAKEAFWRIWKNTAAHVCADGGANRLYDAFVDEGERSKYIPDFICGDFDSLRSEVKQWYERKGTQTLHITDQETTDLQKCFELIRRQVEGGQQRDPSPPASPTATSSTGQKLSRLFFPHCLGPTMVSAASQPSQPSQQRPLLDVIVWGALSGRFDHVMSGVHTLFMVEPQRRVYLMSPESFAVLLKAGTHEIPCSRALEGPTCGLIPIGVSSVRTITSGLKWNLDRTKPLAFGTLVSTSNAFEESDEPVVIVNIETDGPVLWTTEVALH